MPQGCDFTCTNKTCEHYGKKITIHGSWPLKDIDEAIRDCSVFGESCNEEHRTGLAYLKSQGRTKALFVFPNDADREPVGFRTQFYCCQDKIIFDEEFLTREESETASSANQPCKKCGGELKSLKKAIDTGIQCPSCQHKMASLFWFTK